jgi:hypothetical protein
MSHRSVSSHQVLNHGVSVELMLAMLGLAYEFFQLPPEEKAKLYSDDPANKIRLSTSFNVRKETVHNWRDYLRLHCHPLEQYVPDWPANPPSFRYGIIKLSNLLYIYNFVACIFTLLLRTGGPSSMTGRKKK